MVQIIPTLFSRTEQEYQDRINKLNSSEIFREGWVQLDLMDNKFVQNKSISLDVVRKYPLPFKIEAQLMVMNPGQWIEGLIKLKVNRIVFPVEINDNILDLINQIKDNNMEVGLSLNPETEVEKLNPYLDLLNTVLVMGVNPGLEQQKLNVLTFDKVKTIKQKAPALKVGVDGGVNDINIKQLIEAGVDYLAIGSFLFAGDFDENLEKLWETLYE